MSDSWKYNSDIQIKSLLDHGLFKCAANNQDDDEVLELLLQRIRKIAKQGTKVISITGGAGSGKSTFARRLSYKMIDISVIVISTDDFVIGTRDYRIDKLEGKDPLIKYNFDLLKDTVKKIEQLKTGESITVPLYDERIGAGTPLNYDSGAKPEATRDVYKLRRIIGPVDLLIVEGDFQPLGKTDYIIYLHVPDKFRLRNRINRDLKRRLGYSTESIQRNFELRQQLQHIPYTLPVASLADLILLVNVKTIKKNQLYRYDVYQRA